MEIGMNLFNLRRIACFFYQWTTSFHTCPIFDVNPFIKIYSIPTKSFAFLPCCIFIFKILSEIRPLSLPHNNLFILPDLLFYPCLLSKIPLNLAWPQPNPTHLIVRVRWAAAAFWVRRVEPPAGGGRFACTRVAARVDTLAGPGVVSLATAGVDPNISLQTKIKFSNRSLELHIYPSFQETLTGSDFIKRSKCIFFLWNL